MKRASRSLLLLSALCAGSWLVGSSRLQAERPGRILSEPEYRELRQLSRVLDERAQRASDQAERRESWVYRHDKNLLGSMAEIARSANRFDERLAKYRASPWPVEDELRGLLRSARDVQDRVRHSRYADDRALSDWNEIVEILDRMASVIQQKSVPPIDPGRDEYGEKRGPPPVSRESRELDGLTRDLEDRASRAYGMAQRVAAEGPYRREFFQSIRDFHDQTVAFRRRVGNGASNREQIREEASRLMESARQTDESMRRNNAFRDVWPEWQAAMQVLRRILDLPRG